ncbi:hypothetical protein ACFVFH_32180 [Streptomyces sp. NPDC057697]|uniref:hypothetical protein n=1 Tax=Streptomyces sp. NPDC057697 TaxID=3346219 RepID=UPI0036A3DA4F
MKNGTGRPFGLLVASPWMWGSSKELSDASTGSTGSGQRQARVGVDYSLSTGQIRFAERGRHPDSDRQVGKLTHRAHPSGEVVIVLDGALRQLFPEARPHGAQDQNGPALLVRQQVLQAC